MINVKIGELPKILSTASIPEGCHKKDCINNHKIAIAENVAQIVKSVQPILIFFQKLNNAIGKTINGRR